MREARQVKPSLKLQVAHPPDWLPEAHTSADLGETISYNTELVIVSSKLRALPETFSRPKAWDYDLFPRRGNSKTVLTQTSSKVVLGIIFHIPDKTRTS
jgi:hypothetical protein